MVYIMSIYYPNTSGVKFNTKYYVQNHMEQCWNMFKHRGLRSWEVIQYRLSAEGEKPPHIIGVTLVWDSEQALNDAFGDPEAQSLLEDVPNFTNVLPVMFGGNIIGSSSPRSAL